MVSYFSLGPTTSVRVELEALSPTGPYRLEVDHPAKKVVEYFDTPFAALVRHAEIESALADPERLRPIHHHYRGGPLAALAAG